MLEPIMNFADQIKQFDEKESSDFTLTRTLDETLDEVSILCVQPFTINNDTPQLDDLIIIHDQTDFTGPDDPRTTVVSRRDFSCNDFSTNAMEDVWDFPYMKRPTGFKANSRIGSTGGLGSFSFMHIKVKSEWFNRHQEDDGPGDTSCFNATWEKKTWKTRIQNVPFETFPQSLKDKLNASDPYDIRRKREEKVVPSDDYVDYATGIRAVYSQLFSRMEDWSGATEKWSDQSDLPSNLPVLFVDTENTKQLYRISESFIDCRLAATEASFRNEGICGVCGRDEESTFVPFFLMNYNQDKPDLHNERMHHHDRDATSNMHRVCRTCARKLQRFNRFHDRMNPPTIPIPHQHDGFNETFLNKFLSKLLSVESIDYFDVLKMVLPGLDDDDDSIIVHHDKPNEPNFYLVTKRSGTFSFQRVGDYDFVVDRPYNEGELVSPLDESDDSTFWSGRHRRNPWTREDVFYEFLDVLFDPETTTKKQQYRLFFESLWYADSDSLTDKTDAQWVSTMVERLSAPVFEYAFNGDDTGIPRADLVDLVEKRIEFERRKDNPSEWKILFYLDAFLTLSRSLTNQSYPYFPEEETVMDEPLLTRVSKDRDDLRDDGAIPELNNDVLFGYYLGQFVSYLADQSGLDYSNRSKMIEPLVDLDRPENLRTVLQADYMDRYKHLLDEMPPGRRDIVSRLMLYVEDQFDSSFSSIKLAFYAGFYASQNGDDTTRNIFFVSTSDNQDNG